MKVILVGNRIASIIFALYIADPGSIPKSHPLSLLGVISSTDPEVTPDLHQA